MVLLSDKLMNCCIRMRESDGRVVLWFFMLSMMKPVEVSWKVSRVTVPNNRSPKS